MFKTKAKLPVLWLNENFREALLLMLFSKYNLETMTNLVSLFFIV